MNKWQYTNMADPCVTLSDEIFKLEQARGAIIEGQIGGRDHGGGPVHKPNPNDPELKEITKQINAKAYQLNVCLSQPIPNVPMAISATSISSIARNDIRIWPFSETDEPYLLIYALDVPKLTPKVNLPKPKVTKIEWQGLDEGDTLAAPGNILWGMSGAPAPLASPDDVIILAAMIEHDDTKTEAVRTLVEDQMAITLTTNITSVGNRTEFVSRLINGMNGAIAAATSVALGLPDPDDPIGSAQELRLTKADLGKAYHFGSWTRTLTFSGDGASYAVSFKIQRA
jgi:hypothetical protein